MLSIVIYGRNDSHGYNLHKRVALSINSLAEMLDADGDEILFVDYNTPDDLPTFPEAISDTLTEAARRRLRVLRVRPRHHEPFRPFTHLPILEPIARNAAIRRANPDNRWILSTNTDMIFVPHQGQASLSAVVAGLEPACYHLPRFELPEMVWESFDRRDPVKAIDALRQLGPGLHLDEIVYGSPPALYDNHGDFQLMPRAMLDSVHGFDERMRSGWIVDSNMALRLMLRFGRAKSLYPDVVSYHCDHTRVPGQFHARAHVENDYRRFYLEVDQPDLPEQAATWGLAGVELEEISLAQTSTATVLSALRAILPAAVAPPQDVTYNPDVFDLAYYPAEHVLPYLCNLLQPLERRSSVAWFGARPQARDLFTRLWWSMDFQGPLLVPEDAEQTAQAIQAADLIVFEFGAASQDQLPARAAGWHDDDMERLAPVRDALLALVVEERCRIAAGHMPRLVLTVNAIHNRFSALVNDCLSVPRAPFSSRLGHGHVLAEPPPAETSQLTPLALARWLKQHLGRRQDVPITEAVRLLSHAEEMVTGSPDKPRLHGMLRVASCLHATLDYPAFVRYQPAEQVKAAHRLIDSERASHRLAPLVWIPVLPALPQADACPSRLATLEDWEDDHWSAVARRYFMGAFAANMVNRSAAQWVRIHVLNQLNRRALTGAGQTILLMTAGTEPLADVLSSLGARVHVRGPATPATNAFRVPSRLDFISTVPSISYDAVVFTPGTAFADGELSNCAAALSSAAKVLVPGGLLVIAENGEISRPRPDCFSAALPFTEAFIAALDKLGLSPLAMAPSALTAATLDHALAADVGADAPPHFVRVDGDRLYLSGAWFFIKTGAGDAVETLEHDLRQGAEVLAEASEFSTP